MVSLSEGEGEIAGISYRICGSGLPWCLLPSALRLPNGSRLFPRLSERYCTIILGGAYLGMMAVSKHGAAPLDYLEWCATCWRRPAAAW